MKYNYSKTDTIPQIFQGEGHVQKEVLPPRKLLDHASILNQTLFEPFRTKEG